MGSATASATAAMLAASVASRRMRMSRAVPAHAARRPGRRRGRQPPAARAGGLHPPGRRRASTRGCRSGYRVLRKVERDRARGDGPGRRPGGARCRSPSRSSSGSAAGRDAAYGDLMFRLAGPQGDRRSACRRPPRRSSPRSSRRSTARYRDLPVNLYQINWKYRDELRPRFGLLRGARVPDEGRVLVRPRRRRPAAQLPSDVRRLPPGVRALRAHVPRRSRRSRARSAAT